jgi:LDH2 family malate/lactate/ureidoglycolate dehydrogenase
VLGYPGSDSERRVPASALRAVAAAVFEKCGLSSPDAALLAGTLVRADLRGIHSHGVLRVGDYVAKLQTGGVDPRGQPRVVSDAGAALVVDGGNSMGQIGGTFAMRQAIERARTTGVAVAVVRGSNHCGAMDYYAMLALPEAMIGLAATGALPTMAPWGGVDKVLGINPLAVAIPAGQEPPVVLDIAFSASSHGKIRIYDQKGLPIPAGWATDAQGRPTTDARAALDGLLLPIGGYKGTGLALVTGLLATLLSGASFGTELGNMVDGPSPGADGHFFMAIQIGAFADVARFKERLDSIICRLRSSRRAPGAARIYLPGEREAEAERSYGEQGIPLNEETLAGLVATAQRLGVDAAVLARSPGG